MVVTIFLASLLGSFHCAGMCGAFLSIAIGDPAAGFRRQVSVQAAYHAGRAITYIAIGIAVGALGGLVNLAGVATGIRPIAATFTGGMMVLFGIIALLRAHGVRVGRVNLPPAWQGLIRRGHLIAMSRPPIVRALMIGLLTTLLPCGWLYLFAAAAAGTGSAGRGALVMVVFWLGTLPMLAMIGIGIRGLLGPVARRLPTVTAVMMLGVGALTLWGRTGIDPTFLMRRAQAAALTTGIPHPSQAPCCNNHDACH